MDKDIHEVTEGTLYQATDEQIGYTVNTNQWASTPTSVNVQAFDESTGVDVTSIVFPVNTTTVSGDVIALSPMKLLSANHGYRVHVRFTVGTNVYECYFKVKCPR